jgi:hypothetical protein
VSAPYVPGNARIGEPTPQTDPDLFTDAELKAEIRYLTRLDKRLRRPPSPGAGPGFPGGRTGKEERPMTPELDLPRNGADIGNMSPAEVSWLDATSILFGRDGVTFATGEEGLGRGPLEAGRILATVLLPPGSDN